MSNNIFYQHAVKGDWNSYKSEVARADDKLFKKLDERFPIIAKLNKASVNREKYTEHLSTFVILGMVFIPYLVFSNLFIESPNLISVLSSISPLSIFYQLALMVLIQERYNLPWYLSVFPLPCIIIIIKLAEHLIYCGIIFSKNLSKVSTEILETIYMFGKIYTLSVIVIWIFYEKLQHLKFEFGIISIIILSVSTLISLINIWQFKTLIIIEKRKNLLKDEFRSTYTTIMIFFTSWAGFFALLKKNHSKEYIIGICMLYSTITFLLEKLFRK